MSKVSYYNKLYRLQDEALKVVQSADTLFYLTWGTAVSRIYTLHRYSDDLDFFMNHHPDFIKEAKKLEDALSDFYKESFRITYRSESFFRAFVSNHDAELKIEMVNDVGYHWGEFESHDIFNKVDNPMNILSNKICALGRNAGKDISDILWLSYSYSFNWREVIEKCQMKGNWVNEMEVSERIAFTPLDRLSDVNWVIEPDFKKIELQLKTIAKDILMGADNSLFRTVKLELWK